MNSQELNEKAQLYMQNFIECGTKEALDSIDNQISLHDPNDVSFYRQIGSQASDMSNQITEIYYELRADYAKYYAKRFFQLNVEYDKSGAEKTITVNGEKTVLSRSPSKDLIENAVNNEIDETCWVINFLKGHLLSSMNTIKTARNYTYKDLVQHEKTEEHED